MTYEEELEIDFEKKTIRELKKIVKRVETIKNSLSRVTDDCGHFSGRSLFLLEDELKLLKMK